MQIREKKKKGGGKAQKADKNVLSSFNKKKIAAGSPDAQHCSVVCSLMATSQMIEVEKEFKKENDMRLEKGTRESLEPSCSSFKPRRRECKLRRQGRLQNAERRRKRAV